ncbi:MAG: DNA mismatch repair endonuclease MutL [Pseudoflavonifractor capillosus]|uniref:DNA mismatch repair endonuclease MutL n=1 Tax=Pseudoflavonifractor capillosus TaxID=106588 RepID=UPI0023F9787B|nr:DNA mismatch repair endonuclease MutL [Pseudoflavonifractor capillosus]MCI5929015.1 DNA mismatch repair endonuclease MutL [Pseudoflavonifractor capillosus]MDY4660649.1 DNA mismatch repair endonuclease MutL [Pseudoflavonifractor capillosus]
MPHIQPLDPHVADLIAAGEVVERPASVVKELVENAIDAGAETVTVEIQRGGMSLIRVTDNGCGIAADEAETAFLRHATSKIRTEHDLEAIGTLGFRGEALAAIAAVSRVDLLTRTAEENLGAALSLEGGEVVSREEAGCPVGTTMVVRDLFFNTPARLKFMKKDAAEGAAVFAMVQRLALAHPEVSMKFLRDGKQELLTPGDGQMKSAVYSVLGRDLALGLIEVKGSGEDMTVTGFTSLPACCRPTRGYQHFFVNGRYVKSRTMMAALEEAYQNQKMVGKFPACVLHLTCRLSSVDVNVHPTKQEVKFGNERQVFSAVYYAVLSALEGDKSHVQAQVGRPAGRLAPTAGHDTVTPNQTTFRTMTAQEYRKNAAGTKSGLSLHDFAAPKAAAPAAPVSRPKPETRPAENRPIFQAPVRETPRPMPEQPVVRPEKPAEIVTPAPEKAPAPIPEEKVILPEPVELPEEKSVSPVQEVPAPEVQQEPESVPVQPREEEIPWRVAGEVLNTYIIVEQGDKVLLIDKHAAHERMNFDKLKAQGYQPMVQNLLTPAVFTPPAEEGAVLLQNLPLLSQFGFDAEDFGGGAIIVRAAPGDVDAEDVPATLEEIAAKLLTTGRANPDAARDELMHTMACKAAIKGGQKNGPQELEKVAGAVMRGEVKYCPHGRPVAIEMTRGQLEKQFKRA